MLKARRPLAAALVVGAGALALTGCIPLPPALPEAPPIATPQPVEPAPTTASEEPASPSQEPTAPEAGDYPYTVDDGLGDTWSFDVTGVIADPPLRTGQAEPGTYFVGVVFDAAHLEGNVSFGSCFDIFVVGSDGETYDWMTTYAAVTAEDDIYDADDQGFTQRAAAVQLPEGVEPTQVIIRSTYGHPEVPDTVIDVQ